MIGSITSKTTTRLGMKFLIVLLMMAFLAGTLPYATLAATTSCAQKYTVKSGDTLSKIAADYKIDWKELAKANNLTEPYTLSVGQTLCVPGSTSSTTSSTSVSTVSSGSKSTGSFTITRTPNSIVINAKDFPKKSIFYVKVRNRRDHMGDNWIKVGILRTGKNSEGSHNFKLPNKLRDVTVLTVCLKNAISDTVRCQNVTQ